MKIAVEVQPKPEVLDTQGRAVSESLKAHGFEKLAAVSVGRYIELEINSDDEAEALKQAEQMAQFVLVNPLIEKYHIRRVGQ